MTTEKIASRLVELMKEGKWEEAQKELYASDVKSIEPMAGMGFEKETTGLDAIIAKGHKFAGMVDTYHGIEVSEPVIVANSFAVKLDMDIQMKGRGREKMSELCLYQVKDGKVASEEFFM